MNSRILIEHANRQEALHIGEISRAYIEAGLGWTWRPERVLAAIRDPDTAVIKANMSATFAGFAIMRFGWREAHLDLFAVKPCFRRRGVGTALLCWLEKSACTAGILLVRLELRESNKIALNFYEQRGYQKVRRIKGYYRGAENAIELSRDISCDSSIEGIGL